MSQLIQMRQRINAIETIRKITHAMQLISMSTHLRLRDKKNRLEEYQKTVKKILSSVKNTVPDWYNPLFFPDQTQENLLVILVGSQKGLCGVFNTNIMYDFEKSIHEKRFKQGSLITVGKKIREYLTTRLKPATLPLNHIASYDELSWNNLPTLVPKLIDTIIKAEQPYSQVLVYSNYPSGFFAQRLQTTTLIPFSFESLGGEELATKNDFVWEDEPHHILDALAHHQLNATVYTLLVQSLLAEQAARFTSMDNATRNAKYLKENMMLQYNKLRQAKITKELTELSSGFQTNFGA
jgi:F-type H+-transporting ATPase subunit gamma